MKAAGILVCAIAVVAMVNCVVVTKRASSHSISIHAHANTVSININNFIVVGHDDKLLENQDAPVKVIEDKVTGSSTSIKIAGDYLTISHKVASAFQVHGRLEWKKISSFTVSINSYNMGDNKIEEDGDDECWCYQGC